MHPHSEEDIKMQILGPILAGIGIEVAEIQMEHSFSIPVGQTRCQTSRADYVVRRGGDTLFVVEAKNPDHMLTERDRDQAISYGRLLDAIAPYAIVSNGDDTRIYDVRTKQQIDGTGIHGFRVSLEDETVFRFEALTMFLSLSPENLQVFSRNQVNSHMRPLLLDKYRPSLYEVRSATENALDNWLNDEEAPFFAIIGASGTGKTNVLCHWAEQLPMDHLGLFYWGGELTDDFGSFVARDFNLTFSQERSWTELLKRLTPLTRKDGPLVIVIDGIDEWVSANRFQDFHRFAREIVDQHDARIKVVVSCKDTEWDNVMTSRGTPSQFVLSLSQSHQISTGHFNQVEANAALRKYQAEFRVSGHPTERIAQFCRDPFLLRVLAEVYEGQALPSETTAPDILKAYLRKRFRLGGISMELGMETLRAVAQLMAEQGQPTVRISDVRGALGLSGIEPIPPDLFRDNILQWKTEDHEQIGFYFNPLRDYLVAYHVRLWPERAPDDFKTDMLSASRNPMLQSALNWYYPMASDPQQNKMREEAVSRALVLRDIYARIRGQLTALSNRIPPFTVGPIGICLETDDSEHLTGAWSFYSARGEELWTFASAERARAELNVSVTHHNGSLWAINPQDVAINVMLHALEHVIKNSGLRNDLVPQLAHERIERIVQNPLIRSLGFPGMHHPLSVSALDQKAKATKASAEIAFRSQLGQLGIPVPETIDLSSRQIILCDALAEACEGLLSKGIGTLEDWVLPQPDIPPSDVTFRITDVYSPVQLASYVQAYLMAFFNASKALVEADMPMLCDMFPWVSCQPFLYYGELKMEGPWPVVAYAVIPNVVEETTVFIQTDPVQFQSDFHRTIATPHGAGQPKWNGTIGVSNFLMSSMKTLPGVDEPLRSGVYNYLSWCLSQRSVRGLLQSLV